MSSDLLLKSSCFYGYKEVSISGFLKACNKALNNVGYRINREKQILLKLNGYKMTGTMAEFERLDNENIEINEISVEPEPQVSIYLRLIKNLHNIIIIYGNEQELIEELLEQLESIIGLEHTLRICS